MQGALFFTLGTEYGVFGIALSGFNGFLPVKYMVVADAIGDG